MKIKLCFYTFFVASVLAFTISSYLSAQETDEIGDPIEVQSGGVAYIPSDEELVSLLTAVPNPNAVVSPLIQTKWHQGDPFNSMLPMNGNVRPVTGCGIIAAIQIMKYHNHPVRGNGLSEQYTIRTGIQEPVNLNVIYDWNNMLNTYRRDRRYGTEQQRNAVAILAYHVGVAWKRDFIGMRYSSRNLPLVLTAYFGYDRSIQLHTRVYYDDAVWESMIRQQLDAGLPVLYRGYHPGSDHSFVVDGYDNIGRFHINWGWGGRSDGWYSLNNLNPGGGNRSWFNDQYIITNIKPDAGGVSAGIEMALIGFSADRVSVPQNILFTINARVRNLSIFDNFSGGQLGAALVDNNGRIAEVIGTRNISVRAGYQLASTITCTVPQTVSPGQYRLMTVIKPTNGEWRVITKSAIGNGIPNTINLTVTAGEEMGGGYGLALENFSPEKTSVLQNEQFTVSVRPRNRGVDTFNGQLGAALVDNNGNIAAVIGSRNIGLRAGNQLTSTITCRVPNTVSPGQYHLRIVARPTGGEWRIATMSLEGIPTSIDFTVR